MGAAGLGAIGGYKYKDDIKRTLVEPKGFRQWKEMLVNAANNACIQATAHNSVQFKRFVNEFVECLRGDFFKTDEGKRIANDERNKILNHAEALAADGEVALYKWTHGKLNYDGALKIWK